MSLPFSLSYGALWALVIGQSLILLGVVRALYELRQTLSSNALLSAAPDTYVGREAPQFEAVNLQGEAFFSVELLGRVRAFLFVSPTCQTCTITLNELAALQYKAEGNVVVVCRGSSEDCAGLAETYGLALPVIADEDFEISRLFGISTVPTAVLIGTDDRIASQGRPLKGEELEEMLAVHGVGDGARVETGV